MPIICYEQTRRIRQRVTAGSASDVNEVFGRQYTLFSFDLPHRCSIQGCLSQILVDNVPAATPMSTRSSDDSIRYFSLIFRINCPIQCRVRQVDS